MHYEVRQDMHLRKLHLEVGDSFSFLPGVRWDMNPKNLHARARSLFKRRGWVLEQSISYDGATIYRRAA